MSGQPKFKSWVLHLLGIYITLQFAWWAYLLVDLNNELYQLHSISITGTETESLKQTELKGQLEQGLTHRIWMVLGEGSVFMLLLFFGFSKVRKAIAREMELARQQNNFLLSITHELKSPLAALKLQLQTLRSRDLDPEQQDKILSRSQEETERLQLQVEDLLLTARMDSGTSNINMESLDLTKVIDTLVQARYSKELRTGKITIDTSGNMVVMADEQAIRSIVSNLIDNALKYTEHDDTVHISIIRNQAGTIIEVADNGPGISSSEKNKVFNRFYRSGNEHTRNSKGTGLGLYIVNRLVQAHGATIVLKDNQPTGSIFQITFSEIPEQAPS